MEAFFKDKGVRLYLGNTLKILDELPENSVDLIFADPPYNLSNDGFTCHAGKRVSVNKGEWDKSKGFDEDFKFHYQWIEKCKRVLKPNGTMWISGTYHSIYICGFSLQKQGWHIINEICWYKPNAAPNLSCRMFTASHETLLWVKKTKKAKHTFNYELSRSGSWDEDFLKKPGKQMRSIWAITTPKKWEKRYGKHPTQKPENLLKRIILLSSNPGDVILDPFCGSGTTGVVAIRYGRQFVGIDFNRKYLESLAIPRIIDELKTENQDLLGFHRENNSSYFEEVFK
ncbi:DNA-methyltransferase [Desulfurobacterium sp.]